MPSAESDPACRAASSRAEPGRAASGGAASKGARAPRVPGEQRRAGILRAARESFIRFGYDGARTREIAERAGVGEGVLYRHFASKEELFDAAVLEPLTEWVRALAASPSEIAEAASDEQRRAALVTANKALLEAMVKVTPLLGVALFSSTERGQAFYRDHFYPLLEATFAASERAMGRWSAPGFDTRFLMMTGLGTYLAHALDVHFRSQKLDVTATAERYVRLLAEGAMRTQDGDG